MSDRNQVIVLTGPAAGAIAVVRLLGPGVVDFLRSHFSRTAQAGRCVHGELRDGTRVIDDPVVVLVDERTADVNLHGGTWVVREMVDLARRAGFAVVEGETPPEAMDGATFLDREMLAALPLARTELGLRALLSQPRAWTRFVAPNGTVPEATLAQQIGHILADRALCWLLHPPRVAIVGAPNVGKSTLANQLFAQERSIVADLPGTTRDWVGEIANIDGLPVLLVDTPGLRDTPDPIERAAIATSAAQVERADLIVLVLDATRPLAGEQHVLLTRFPQSLVVANKMDQSPTRALDTALPTVATTGHGVDALRRHIAAHFGCQDLDPTRPRWWTPRHRDLLLRAQTNPTTLTQLLNPEP